jgi:hypothetical protein
VEILIARNANKAIVAPMVRSGKIFVWLVSGVWSKTLFPFFFFGALGRDLTPVALKITLNLIYKQIFIDTVLSMQLVNIALIFNKIRKV